MSVLPLSLFYGSRAEPLNGGFLGRGSLPKREIQREGHSLVGSWGEAPEIRFLGHSHKPPSGERTTTEVV